MLESAEVASDEAEIGESCFGIDSTVAGDDSRLVDGSSASIYTIVPAPAVINDEAVLPPQTSNDNKLQSGESDANTFVV